MFIPVKDKLHRVLMAGASSPAALRPGSDLSGAMAGFRCAALTLAPAAAVEGLTVRPRPARFMWPCDDR